MCLNHTPLRSNSTRFSSSTDRFRVLQLTHLELRHCGMLSLPSFTTALEHLVALQLGEPDLESIEHLGGLQVGAY